MKKYTFHLFLALLVAFVISCKEEEIPGSNPNPDPDSPNVSKPMAKTVDVNVVLPTGSTVNLSKTKLSTGMMDFNVDASGKTKAVLPDSIFRIAYLLDENNRILLMGIIHEKNKTIDAGSTAEALFYLGAGVFYRPKPVIHQYLAASSTLPGMQAFRNKISEMIKNDIGLIDNGAFVQPLAEYLAEYSKEVRPIEIRSGQIFVDPITFQSGIQIFENDALTVKLANTYRRRAHAFFYKTAYKPKGSKEETVLLSSIGESEKATVSKEIEPTSAFSSTLGTIFDWVIDKGIEYGRKETDPISLPLGDNEDEATYKVRVVGTSFLPTMTPQMTQEERKTWEKLMVKQFYLDFIAPILTEMFSEIKGNQDTNFGLEAFEYFLSQSPAIWELIEKGDFKKATEETVKYLLLDKDGQELQKEFIELLVNKYKNLPNPTWIDLDRDYNNANATEKYIKLIKAVELTVKLLDMAKLTAEIAMSNRIDVFTAKAIRSDVKINPNESTVIPFSNLALKAESKAKLSEGQSFLYKWSTTGKYGIIVSGNQKGAFIETSSATVNFRSEKNASELEENNFETVKVEIYIKSGTTLSFVNEGKASVNVVKSKLVMRPDDITLSGKNKESVTLYLERSDFVNDIISTSTLEYKVEWSLSGGCGMIDGITKTATTRGNKIVYQALDEKSDECIETVTAHVYFRKPGEDWVLREKVTGKVKISNDPKKIILNVPLITKDWKLSANGGYTTGVNLIAPVPIHEKAVKYTVKTYGFKIANNRENRSWTWLAGQAAPSDWAYPPGGEKGIVGNQYHFTISSTWCSGETGCDEKIPGWHTFYKGWGGMANIVIEIKD